MNAQIICFEDITAVNVQKFYKRFVSRLKAQQINIKQIDLVQITEKFINLFPDKKIKYQTQEFYFYYLSAVHSFLLNLQQNTCYIIKNTPLLFNMFKYISKNNNSLVYMANSIINKFSHLLEDILVYINIISFTDSVKDIIEDKSSYKKYIYDNMIHDYNSNSQKIAAIENMKDILQNNIIYFRKNHIKSIKLEINFTEDINNNIQKIFNILNID